jgi:hypothetical protein
MLLTLRPMLVVRMPALAKGAAVALGEATVAVPAAAVAEVALAWLRILTIGAAQNAAT